MESVVKILAKELDKSEQYVKNVIDLIDEGNTIPFIARYRKEMHGAMDDTVLRELADRLSYLRNLEARREEVKKGHRRTGQAYGGAVGGYRRRADAGGGGRYLSPL